MWLFMFDTLIQTLLTLYANPLPPQLTEYEPWMHGASAW